MTWFLPPGRDVEPATRHLKMKPHNRWSKQEEVIYRQLSSQKQIPLFLFPPPLDSRSTGRPELLGKEQIFQEKKKKKS